MAEVNGSSSKDYKYGELCKNHCKYVKQLNAMLKELDELRKERDSYKSNAKVAKALLHEQMDRNEALLKELSKPEALRTTMEVCRLCGEKFKAIDTSEKG